MPWCGMAAWCCCGGASGGTAPGAVATATAATAGSTATIAPSAALSAPGAAPAAAAAAPPCSASLLEESEPPSFDGNTSDTSRPRLIWAQEREKRLIATKQEAEAAARSMQG